MNSNPDSQPTADFTQEAETSEAISIDEFFKQLEAKEKDLDISSEMIIEIEESDFEEPELSGFVKSDFSSIQPEKPSPKIPSPTENLSNQLESFNQKNEILKLQDQLAKLESERAAMFENNRRRHNDFENFKNRTERERSETFRNQLSNLATQMLPVLDNMNRALDSTKSISTERTTDFQQFFEGIEMVNQQLNEILADMGVQPIKAVGENFDPHRHEAVATEVSDELPSNTITTELLRGYRIGDRIIRPSMVKVSISSNSGRLSQPETVFPNNPDENETTDIIVSDETSAT
jgi:molecular chaperone GrpE